MRALGLGLAITLTFAAVEFVAGTLFESLALVADAGHMLVDSAGLVMALVASLIARRPSDARRTYGYARAEVLAVPLQVLMMFGVAGYVMYEALAGGGHDVATGPVIVTGAIGLVANLTVLRLLHSHGGDHATESLATKGARLEVMADALGSVLVVVAAGGIVLTGWNRLDAIAGFVIAAFILPRAWMLLRAAGAVLFEGTPPGVNLDQMTDDAEQIPGVIHLHDLHVWSVAPQFTVLSAHVEVADMSESEHVLPALTRLFQEKHGIGHVTLQPETQELHRAIACCEWPDARVSEHAHGFVH